MFSTIGTGKKRHAPVLEISKTGADASDPSEFALSLDESSRNVNSPDDPRAQPPETIASIASVTASMSAMPSTVFNLPLAW
jgi:hypothetical protein